MNEQHDERKSWIGRDAPCCVTLSSFRGQLYFWMKWPKPVNSADQHTARADQSPTRMMPYSSQLDVWQTALFCHCMDYRALCLSASA